MVNIFKKIFSSSGKKPQTYVQVTASVTRNENGEKIQIPHTRKILREPNLVEKISIPSFAMEFNNDIKIQDLKDLRRKYSVNLFTMNCKCPDFQNNHKDYPPHHLKRICQHLMDAMDKPLRETNPFLRKVTIRFYNKPSNFFYHLDFDEKYVLYFDESSYRANIIAEYNPDIEYAYNIIEDRWSSKGIPKQAKNLISEMSKIICLE